MLHRNYVSIWLRFRVILHRSLKSLYVSCIYISVVFIHYIICNTKGNTGKTALIFQLGMLIPVILNILVNFKFHITAFIQLRTGKIMKLPQPEGSKQLSSCLKSHLVVVASITWKLIQQCTAFTNFHMGPNWHRSELTWVRINMGPNQHGSELTWVRIDIGPN